MSITLSMHVSRIRANRKLSADEVSSIIALHEKWLKREEGGARADFSDAELEGFDFSGADLREANFIGSKLDKAKFVEAKLLGARFFNASLSDTDFTDAQLDGAVFLDAQCLSAKFVNSSLKKANLAHALLWNTDFTGADLTNADLHAAPLCDGRLCNATLVGADLSCADLDYANFSGADCKNALFDHTANTPWADFTDADLNDASFLGTSIDQYYLAKAKGGFIPLSCPDEGEFIGWTKSGEGCIIKLLIPVDAKRSSIANRLCRASGAKTIAIYDEHGEEVGEATGGANQGCFFRTGEYVCAGSENKEVWFFISRAEAERRFVTSPDEGDESSGEDSEFENVEN